MNIEIFKNYRKIVRWWKQDGHFDLEHYLKVLEARK